MGTLKTERKRRERLRLQGKRLDVDAPDHPNRATMRRTSAKLLNRAERKELQALPKIDRAKGRLVPKRVLWGQQAAIRNAATDRVRAEAAAEVARKLTRGPCGIEV